MKIESHVPTYICPPMKFREFKNYTSLKTHHKMPQNARKPLVEPLPINIADFYCSLVKIEPQVTINICQPVQFRQLKKNRITQL
jgi:hypothetical protein